MEPSKELPDTKRKPPNAGKGRPPGAKNKITADVKAMILEALKHAGGAEYLYMQAFDNPKTFLALVGRVLPLQVSGDPDNPLVPERPYLALTTDEIRAALKSIK